MKKILVEINKDGNAEFYTMGFEGSNCKEATKNLERLLGKATQDVNTPDFYKEVIKVEICNDF